MLKKLGCLILMVIGLLLLVALLVIDLFNIRFVVPL